MAKKVDKGKSDKPSDGKGKRGRKRKATMPFNDHWFDFRRPVLDVATELDYGQAVADGKNPDPNKGLMTGKQLGDAVRARIKAEEAGEYGGPVPPLYSMIRRNAAASTNGRCIIAGQKGKGKKAPKDTPAKFTSAWGDKDRVHVNAGTGKLEPLRVCHQWDGRKLVTDPDENILAIGNSQYVVGTPEISAVFLCNGARSGNRHANLIAGKRLSFEGKDRDLASVVGRFNKGWDAVTLDDGTDPGCEMGVPPNSFILDWGYVEKSGKRMTCAQIRAAITKGDTKGMKYVAVYNHDNPLIGHSFNASKLWQGVKREMARGGKDDNDQTALDRFKDREPRGEESSDAKNRSWYNLFNTQCRTSPHETVPHGFASAETCCAPCAHFGDSEDEQLVRFVLGCHVGAEYSENRWAARARLYEDESEVDAEPIEALKPKTEKPKADKKAADKKGKKAADKAADKKAADKKAATQPDSEAAPVKDVETDKDKAATPAPAEAK